MTQKQVQISAYAILLVLGMGTAGAETKRQGIPELLPAPKCCGDKPEVVLVTTEGRAGGKLINRVYLVEKLVPPAEPVIMEVGSGDRIFGWATQTPAGTQVLDEPPEDTLIKLLTGNVEPASWSDQGGFGTIDYFPPGKALVVNQTEDVQRQVGDLLGKLNGVLEKETSVCAPTPGLSLLGPGSMPVGSLPGSSRRAIEAPMPCFYPQPVPNPAPVAADPFSFPCPATMLAAAPAVQTGPTTKMYQLDVLLRQRQEDGTAPTCNKMQIVFPANGLKSAMMLAEDADQGCRKGLLQLKATLLKKDRMRVELFLAQAKADRTGDGRVALHLNTQPVMERTVKLHKKTKVIVERDEHGKTRKWVELLAKEIPQSPVPCAVLPPPPPVTWSAWPMPPEGQRGIEHVLAAPAVSGPLPMTCMAASMPGPTAYPVMPPPAIVPCMQDQSNQAWELRAGVEEGKTNVALRQGRQDSMTVRSLEIKTKNGPLEVNFCSERIQVEHRWFQACADTLSSVGSDGSLVLEGHVNFMYKRDGQDMNVTADRIYMDLANGHLQIDGQGFMGSSSESSSR